MPNIDLTSAHNNAAAALRAKLIEEARVWIGTPYLYGGNSSSAIDCSHFIYQVFNSARQSLAMSGPAPQLIEYRSTSAIEASKLFFSINIPEAGDLVLWDGHVGIITNPQTGIFIGAQTSTGVAEASYTSGYWAKKSGKRFLRFIQLY